MPQSWPRVINAGATKSVQILVQWNTLHSSPDSPLDGPAVVGLEGTDDEECEDAIVQENGREEPKPPG